jgi:hypothetical protein
MRGVWWHSGVRWDHAIIVPDVLARAYLKWSWLSRMQQSKRLNESHSERVFDSN